MPRWPLSSSPDRAPLFLDTRPRPESVEKTEQPKGNFVSEAGFDIIGGDITVFDTLDLVVGFGLAADFKGISRLYPEVPPIGQLDRRVDEGGMV